MLTLPPSVRIYLAVDKVDMRCGHDGLGAIVRNQWRLDIFEGHLFVFVGRKGDRVKILFWDGTGLCIFMKRLERGRFADLWSEASGAPVRLTSSELALFIEGCALVGKKMLSPREVMRNELAVGDRV